MLCPGKAHDASGTLTFLLKMAPSANAKDMARPLLRSECNCQPWPHRTDQFAHRGSTPVRIFMHPAAAFSHPFHSSSPCRFASLRWLFLLCAFCVSLAHADEYTEVNQLSQAGQYAQALVLADQYLSKQPRDPQMRFLKVVIQSDTGKTQEAIATFVQITQDYPELPEPYNNLAVLYAGQSEWNKARAALETALRTNPNYATAHENLGDVYVQLAGQAYRQALQLNASSPGIPAKLDLVRRLLSPAGG